MAINFLDNIQLNQNQILGARIENVTSDPGAANGGDIIFNSTSKILKYYDGTSPFNASGWISLTSSGSVATAAGLGSIKLASDTTQTVAANTVSSTASRTYGVQLNSNDQAVVNVPWVDTNTGMTSFDLAGDTGSQTIEDGNTLTVAGGTNITTAAAATDKVTINLDASPTLAGVLTVEGAGQSSFGGQVTVPETPSASTDAASKGYVDSSVAGGLNVKGGFNANTGAITSGGNLTSGSSRVAIAIGDYYVVTTAGDFFGNASTPLTTGDSVLVQTAAAVGASVEGDFAVIQSDTDLATSTNVGIGNVVSAANGTDLAGTKATYSSGTATIGVDIKNTTVASAAIAEMEFLVFDGSDTGHNLALDISNLATFVGANTGREFSATSSSGTTHTFNHNLNTLDVMVQVYDASSNETVYASVNRNTVNQVIVTTAASANIRCLIQKIG